MDRRGFLKTLLMLPVAAMFKPKDVPGLVAGLKWRSTGTNVVVLNKNWIVRLEKMVE